MTGCGCTSPFHPGSSQKPFANVYRGSFSARTSPPSWWAASYSEKYLAKPRDQATSWGDSQEPAAAHSKPDLWGLVSHLYKISRQGSRVQGLKSQLGFGMKCCFACRALLAGGGETNSLHITDVSHVPKSCTRKRLVTMVLEVALDFTQTKRAVWERGQLHLSLKTLQ